MCTSVMVVLCVVFTIVHGAVGHDYCERNDMMALMVRLRDLSTEYHTEMKNKKVEINSKLTHQKSEISQMKNEISQLKIPVLYFRATTPNGILLDGGIPIFQDVRTSGNEYNTEVRTSGNEYNTQNRKFLCHIGGLYHFSATFIVGEGSPHETRCNFIHNGQRLVSIYAAATGGWQTASGSVYVDLRPGDTFYMGNCTGWGLVDTDITSWFTGALIHN